MSYQEKGVVALCFVAVVMFGISAAVSLGKRAELSSESSADKHAALRRNPSQENEDNELKQHDNDKSSGDDAKDVQGSNFFKRIRNSAESTTDRSLHRLRRNANSNKKKSPKDRSGTKTEKPTKLSQLNAIQLQADDKNGYYSNMTGNDPVKALGSWKPVSWCENQTSKFFRFEASSGSIRILKSGLYYIYAQITYNNVAALNKYEVRVDANKDPLFSCVRERRFPSVTSPSPVLENCHAGSVTWLQTDQRVSIWDGNGYYRTMDLTPQSTFWGIMRIGNQ